MYLFNELKNQLKTTLILHSQESEIEEIIRHAAPDKLDKAELILANAKAEWDGVAALLACLKKHIGGHKGLRKLEPEIVSAIQENRRLHARLNAMLDARREALAAGTRRPGMFARIKARFGVGGDHD